VLATVLPRETKTISIDLEAYERLRRARRSRSESFSMVIKRATWKDMDRLMDARGVRALTVRV
jgi:predicted CopG family antitoxin